MKKKLYIVIGLVIVSTAWYLGRLSTSNDSTEESGRTPQNDNEKTRPVPSFEGFSPIKQIEGPQKQKSVREEIARIIEEEVQPISKVEDLEKYLDELEQRAIRKGKVTALEVEPGMEAITIFTDKLGQEKAEAMRQRFSSRMVTLSPQFRGTEEEPPRPDMDALADRITKAQGQQKQDLIRKYVETAEGLEPGEMEKAMQRLNEIKK